MARAAVTVSRLCQGVAKLRDLPRDDDLFLPLALVVAAVGVSSFITISSPTMRSNIVPSMATSMLAPLSALVAIPMKSALVIFVSMFGLCASVFSMMTANASTYAASGSAKTFGLFSQYLAAKASISRSIF